MNICRMHLSHYRNVIIKHRTILLKTIQLLFNYKENLDFDDFAQNIFYWFSVIRIIQLNLDILNCKIHVYNVYYYDFKTYIL